MLYITIPLLLVLIIVIVYKVIQLNSLMLKAQKNSELRAKENEFIKSYLFLKGLY